MFLAADVPGAHRAGVSSPISPSGSITAVFDAWRPYGKRWHGTVAVADIGSLHRHTHIGDLQAACTRMTVPEGKRATAVNRMASARFAD
jgi:hypothetical protein